MLRLRRIWPYAVPYWPVFAAGFACVVLSNFFTTLVPQFLQRGIDALGPSGSFAEVRRAMLLMLGVAVAGGIARYGMRETLNGVSRRIETDLRDRLYEHLQRLSADFYDRYATGDLMARATNDLLAVRMVVGPAVMYLLDTATRTALVLPYMLLLSPSLTGIALLPLIALPIGMVTIGQAIHRRTMAVQAQYAALTSAVHENLSGVRIVRAYRQEAAEIARFRTISEEYARRNLALARVSGAFHPLLGLIGGLGAVAVIGVGGRQVMQGTLTMGEFVAYGVYLTTLVWPMIALGWVVNLVQRGEAAMRRLLELFDARPAITSPPRPVPLPAGRRARALVFEDVWFRYPNAEDRGWVLRGISFQLEPGRALGIVGPTGAGKSTLAELIVRTYDPDRGRILLDGVDIRTLDLAELRRNVGFVPQETFLFSDTLRHNVLLGAPDDGRLERVAEISQLSTALPDLPAGFDTRLGERGINLSGGQKQRAAIARALARDPPVFVLDDALSAVDAQTEERILHRLRDALARRTRVIISHRLSAVRDADWILVLDGGVVVEEGTHQVLMAQGGRYWELLRRQQLEHALEEDERVGR
ncbi:MAG TPA: ABC transporter ATP-binding protein [Gemmatimonadales bacterium]|jgi:ATP-binding cassette subfamily B protein|nr:ABC transporter ATP-binding protein [Gemmatimonadales bacterium]